MSQPIPPADRPAHQTEPSAGSRPNGGHGDAPPPSAEAAAGSPTSSAPAVSGQGFFRTASRRAGAPFAWQHEQRLLLLDEEPIGWVVAELRFDAKRCRYVEVRRATYRWPREAVGVLLSRALPAGETAVARTSVDLFLWLAAHQSTSDRLNPFPVA
jgi:hypothetical protein